MTNQDSSNTGTLSEKQLSAIPVIIASRTMMEAAEKIGMARNTIYDWLKNPAFKAELQRQREVVVEEALEQLKMNAVKAVDNLGALLDHELAGFRRTVSLEIMTLVMKAREQTKIAHLEKRLADLERQLSERTGAQTK
jgi:hypothetical protein